MRRCVANKNAGVSHAAKDKVKQVEEQIPTGIRKREGCVSTQVKVSPQRICQTRSRSVAVVIIWIRCVESDSVDACVDPKWRRGKHDEAQSHIGPTG